MYDPDLNLKQVAEDVRRALQEIMAAHDRACHKNQLNLMVWNAVQQLQAGSWKVVQEQETSNAA